jgi:hypothetical protein
VNEQGVVRVRCKSALRIFRRHRAGGRRMAGAAGPAVAGKRGPLEEVLTVCESAWSFGWSCADTDTYIAAVSRPVAAAAAYRNDLIISLRCWLTRRRRENPAVPAGD